MPVEPTLFSETTLSPFATQAELNDAWRRDVGEGWWWVLAALTVGCAVAGACAPLIDPDLPMHLRTAEWIMAEGRVPFLEPFAWTRAGEPFYAYSWLAELLYWGAFTLWGLDGLHLLHGMTAAATFLAVIALGRTARWTPWATLLSALISFAVWITFIAAIRPQTLMGVTLALGWLSAELIARRRVRSGTLLAFALAALTVNVHIMFPLTMMPVLRLLAASPVAWRHTMLFVIANLVGWLCTPYAFELIALLKLNFVGNALIGPATSVMELEAGFRALMHIGMSIRLVALILMFLPFLLLTGALTDRERVLYAVAWAGGLFLFGNAVRGIVIWVAASLPLLARAIAQIPLPQIAINRRVTVAATALVPLGLMGGFVRDNPNVPKVTATRETRQLEVYAAPRVEPIAQLIECELQPPRGTKAFVIFNFGSYFVYRLPTLSFSIDGRNIFPDSVAQPEAFQIANDGPLKTGPWRSADLAIALVGHAVSLQLDSAPEWQRLRVVIPPDSSGRPLALWGRRSWLAARGAASREVDTVRVTKDVPERSCRPIGGRGGEQTP